MMTCHTKGNVLKKREKPLMTWDELFALNGITAEDSADGQSHFRVQVGDRIVDLDENFDIFIQMLIKY